ncbi:hypothetical protein HHK36_006545 [Tetracentron sinense]|uniref:Uncharacterized protein n=1 Tax=Tetracentron sinense TaxID=13715 RepID=A0A834ZHF2_TETSI|nr:hypothetical protein HHK36_006545 [Tetracentron sinense]
MTTDEKGNSSLWSREQEKAFEIALAVHPEDSTDRWEKIAADVPGKTLAEIKHHYELLVEDIDGIESGRVPLPCYASSSEGLTDHAGEALAGKKSGHFALFQNDSNHGGKASRAEQERRKGIAWTEEEHRLFLLGLDKYGKGDWRSISRNFVVSRTPTQVASHAQKYFIRLNSMNKDRRRSSIHDITSVENGDIAALQGPITGQTNGATAGASSGKSVKQPPQPPTGASGVGMYGTTTIGQPIGGPLVSAVGTPVNLPSPAHMAYGVRAPVHGAIVPGAPMNMAPMTYPMPHRKLGKVRSMPDEAAEFENTRPCINIEKFDSASSPSTREETEILMKKEKCQKFKEVTSRQDVPANNNTTNTTNEVKKQKHIDFVRSICIGSNDQRLMDRYGGTRNVVN